jgi:divalent metal cation (Fe/Co/Zn/Cd) transporter
MPSSMPWTASLPRFSRTGFGYLGRSMDRLELVSRALALAYFTVVWNVLEGGVAIWAAISSGSDALLGFGLDSGVESLSGLVLIWRLNVERRHVERAEDAESRALKLIGLTFFALAAFVAYESTTSLVNSERPETSWVGIGITFLSIIVMPILATRKERVGKALGSRAVIADSAETWACVYLSVVVLAGLALNALFGWWWADPIAALFVVGFLAKEGLEALSGEHDYH